MAFLSLSFVREIIMFRRSLPLPTADQALPGRDQPMPVVAPHRVTGQPLTPPWPSGSASLLIGMGCFWGAERLFWQLPGVLVTAVGYAGGHTPNPTYDEVCSGGTGHSEVVLVVYQPQQVSLMQLLATFWEGHDPTQGMRQGNDVGTQYRSVLYLNNADDLAAAESSRDRYQQRLSAAGYGPITTEIRSGVTFYYAEPEHQQYLDRYPNGYCGLAGTGVSCPVGLEV